MPAAAAASLLSLAETRAHVTTKILLQQSSIKGIKVAVDKSFWPNAENFASLPARCVGTIMQWVNKERLTICVEWFDGRETE